MKFICDLHTHTIASGHGSVSTVADMAKAAHLKGIEYLGISDHGPSTPGSASPSYFRSLSYAPKNRCNVRILYGIEANITDSHGSLDLENSVLSELDYVIASVHLPIKKPGDLSENTLTYINAMRNPCVKIIGHSDDTRYPVDRKALVESAITNHVLLEINNASLAPDSFRGNTRSNNIEMLLLLKKAHYPVILSSDSHGTGSIAEYQYILPLLSETGFPENLIINCNLNLLNDYFNLSI